MKKWEWNISYYTVLIKIVVFLRILFGPTIFFFPRLTAIMSFMLDWIDGEIYKRAGYDHTKYSFYDKILDYYWYIWILLYILLNNVPYKSFFIILFLYRSVGQVLYFFTKKEIFMVIFFNVFEIFFFYYLAVTLPGVNTVLLEPKAVIFALSIIIVMVFIREYILHLKKSNLSSMFFSHTTYWSSVTFNKYKALGFMVIFFALLSVLPLVSNSDLIYKITKAIKIPQTNKITYYSSQGTLTGFIKKGDESVIFDFQLFDKSDLLLSRCVGRVEVSPVVNKDNKGYFFIYNNCLKLMPDGKYLLLLYPVNQKQESIRIEFNIVAGRLSQ